MHASYLEYICAGILPLGYIVGLLFTLKTHAHLYAKKHEGAEEGTGGHGHGDEGEPEWSKLKCVIILLVSTVAYALIAESMTDSITPALDQMGISESFAGLTLIGLTPNVAEIVNSVQFAMQDNITMSLEISNVGSIQICLIQMPILIVASIFLFGSTSVVGALCFPSSQHTHSNPNAARTSLNPTTLAPTLTHELPFPCSNAEESFKFVFPQHDVVMIFMAVLIMNYITMDGRCNYFVGAVLLLVYLVVLSSFWFVPN